MEQIELEPARHSVCTSLFATPHPPMGYEPAVLLLLYNRRKKLFGKADDPYVATTQVRWHVVVQRSGTPWLSVSLEAWQPWLCPLDSDVSLMHGPTRSSAGHLWVSVPGLWGVCVVVGGGGAGAKAATECPSGSDRRWVSTAGALRTS